MEIVVDLSVGSTPKLVEWMRTLGAMFCSGTQNFSVTILHPHITSIVRSMDIHMDIHIDSIYSRLFSRLRCPRSGNVASTPAAHTSNLCWQPTPTYSWDHRCCWDPSRIHDGSLMQRSGDFSQRSPSVPDWQARKNLSSKLLQFPPFCHGWLPQ